MEDVQSVPAESLNGDGALQIDESDSPPPVDDSAATANEGGDDPAAQTSTDNNDPAAQTSTDINLASTDNNLISPSTSSNKGGKGVGPSSKSVQPNFDFDYNGPPVIVSNGRRFEKYRVSFFYFCPPSSNSSIRIKIASCVLFLPIFSYFLLFFSHFLIFSLNRKACEPRI
jgi:hypothetical protein